MQANSVAVTLQGFKPRPGSHQLQWFTFQCYKKPIKPGTINKTLQKIQLLENPMLMLTQATSVF